jgi:hypothetical protein
MAPKCTLNSFREHDPARWLETDALDLPVSDQARSLYVVLEVLGVQHCLLGEFSKNILTTAQDVDMNLLDSMYCIRCLSCCSQPVFQYQASQKI